jgi:hypothetical protein
MDPYLESPAVWPDFHSAFINALREHLVPLVRPRYSVRIEERVYLEFEPGTRKAPVRPDLTIADRGGRSPGRASSAVATAIPVKVAVVLPEESREVFLVVRDLAREQVVTVIELLSPANKRSPSAGREVYLEKRNAVLKSPAHLVELDLLRAGARMPMRDPLPAGQYHVVVSRRERRPECDVYSWSLRDRLPAVPVPLAEGDPDVRIDLQAVVDAVYERAGYDYTVDYSGAPAPPLAAGDEEWARERLEASPGPARDR